MRQWLALGLFVTGCGRLEFGIASDAPSSDTSADSRACTPVGHDEDADGIDDACDLCPQRPDSGLDTDGDGIGDDCDLSPSPQTRVVFDPFLAPNAAVWATMQGTYQGDFVLFDNPTMGRGAFMAGTPGVETFELTGTLLAGDPTQTQISININDTGAPTYYCELRDAGAGISLRFTYFDGATYSTISSAALPGRFDSGAFRLILDHTPPTSTCYGEWKGQRVSATGPNPPGVTPATSGIGTFQVQAQFESFVRLQTP